MTRLYILFLIVITAFLSLSLDWPNELMNLSLAVILLSVEVYNFFIFQKNVKSSGLIKLKSNNWLSAWIMVAFLLYWFSDEFMNIWNILAIFGIIIGGILASIQNFRIYYIVDECGIRNLNENKLIASSDITETDFNNEQIAIHTKKYRNELIIKSSKVESPSWEFLTTEVSKLDDKNKD